MGTSPLFYFIMVVFNELRVTEDGQYLIIDARVRKETIYNDVVIQKIVIGTQRNYSEDNLRSKNLKGITITVDNKKELYERFDAGFLNLKATREEDEVDLKNDLIFVYIVTNNNVDVSQCPVLPCNMTDPVTVGVTMNMANIYNQFMRYIDELNNATSCTKNTAGFTDFILRYNAFLLAIDSKHYTKGIEYFNKWFGKDKNLRVSNCGCNG